MRTVFEPNISTPTHPELIREWSVKKWNTKYETVRVREDTPGESVVIACDGSACSEGSGYGWYEEFSGSWSAGGSTRKAHGYAQYAESHAILTALQTFTEAEGVLLYSDCFNVVEAFQRLLRGEVVKTQAHRDSWVQELYIASLLAKDRKVEITWVKSHSNHLGNRIADKLANWGRKAAIHESPLDPLFVEKELENLHYRASFSIPKKAYSFRSEPAQ